MPVGKSSGLLKSCGLVLVHFIGERRDRRTDRPSRLYDIIPVVVAIFDAT